MPRIEVCTGCGMRRVFIAEFTWSICGHLGFWDTYTLVCRNRLEADGARATDVDHA